jgi:hypothetical protein
MAKAQDLTSKLAQYFNYVEKEIKNATPEGKAHIMIYARRDYKGNLKIEYTVMGKDYGDEAKTNGTDLLDVMTEYLRRCGFEITQQISLEAPAIDL